RGVARGAAPPAAGAHLMPSKVHVSLRSCPPNRTISSRRSSNAMAGRKAFAQRPGGEHAGASLLQPESASGRQVHVSPPPSNRTKPRPTSYATLPTKPVPAGHGTPSGDHAPFVYWYAPRLPATRSDPFFGDTITECAEPKMGPWSGRISIQSLPFHAQTSLRSAEAVPPTRTTPPRDGSFAIAGSTRLGGVWTGFCRVQV